LGFERKKYSAAGSDSKRWDRAVGGKGQAGRRPLRGETPRGRHLNTLWFPSWFAVTRARSKDARGRERGRCSFSGVGCGRTWEVTTPGEHVVPPWTNPPGSNKGRGFSGGWKPLKHPLEAERFSWQVQEGNGSWKRESNHGKREKL